MFKSTLANIFLKSPAISTTSINSYVLSIFLFPYRLITSTFSSKKRAAITAAVFAIAFVLFIPATALEFTIERISTMLVGYHFVHYWGLLHRIIPDSEAKLTNISERTSEIFSNSFDFYFFSSRMNTLDIIAPQKVMHFAFNTVVGLSALQAGQYCGTRFAGYIADIEEGGKEYTPAANNASGNLDQVPTAPLTPAAPHVTAAHNTGM